MADPNRVLQRFSLSDLRKHSKEENVHGHMEGHMEGRMETLELLTSRVECQKQNAHRGPSTNCLKPCNRRQRYGASTLVSFAASVSVSEA